MIQTDPNIKGDPKPITEAEVDSKISTHSAVADAHHAKTTDAAEITSGRFVLARMPDGTSGYVLTAKGAGVDPAYESVAPFPAGTRMLFDQDTAPTGWTRDITATLDDRCIRIVVGVRAPDGGSWTISGLTQASHDHGGTASAGSHQHYESKARYPGSQLDSFDDFGSPPHGTGGSLACDSYYNTWGSYSATLPYYMVSAGGAHTHTLTSVAPVISSDGTWRPLYRDVIVASKD